MPIAAPAKKEAPLPGESPASKQNTGIGGNNPPPEEQVRADFHEAMIERHATYEARIDELNAAAIRAKVDDEESVGRAGDLVRSIRAMDKAVAEVHKEVKQPYFEAGKVADGIKNGLVAKLSQAKLVIERKQTEFLRAEEAKREAIRREQQIAAQREADLAAEAERKRAAAEFAGDLEVLAEVEVVAAPVVQKAPEPIRSADTGVVVGGQKVWQAQVTDYEVAVIQMLDDEKVMAAIDNCAARRVRAGVRKIEGVKIWQAIQARTR